MISVAFPFFLKANIFMLIAQLYLTLCNPMDCSPSSSSVQGILQTRILEWVAITFSRGSEPRDWTWVPQPRDWTWISFITDRFFTVWATREYFYRIKEKAEGGYIEYFKIFFQIDPHFCHC